MTSMAMVAMDSNNWLSWNNTCNSVFKRIRELLINHLNPYEVKGKEPEDQLDHLITFMTK